MTAPGPDLDALENTVDAMRQAGVSGVTLSVDEADALIAAARERDALERRAEQAEQREARMWHALATVSRKHVCSLCDLDDAEWASRAGYNEALDDVRKAIDAALAEGQDD